jgi:hypothetical protein
MFVGSPLYFEGLSGLNLPLYAIELFINKIEHLTKEATMALINLNIKNFKKDAGGIANRLIDDVVNKVENKLENAVEDAFASGLKKIGLSGGVARQLSSRFSDSITSGRADEFFRSSTAEQNRATPEQIRSRLLAGAAETTLDARQRINTADLTGSEIMQFPDQLGEYHMVLDFQSYERPSPQMEAIFRRFQTIILPIPKDLREQFQLNVSSSPQGQFGGLANMGVDLLRGAGDRVSGTEFAMLYGVVSQFVESSPLLGGAAGASALGQALGAVPNPHLQAIFSGVELRTHTFQWTFAPRNPQESLNLKAIIKEIKKNSLPSYSTTGTAALQYPPMVEIKLKPWNDGLIRFKKCLVQSVSVNYAPNGLPSFFQGTREPTMIEIEIQFLETEIQTARDYGLNSSDTRSDGIQDFVNRAKEGAEALGFKETLDAFETGKNKFYQGVSNGAAGTVTPGRARDQ